jgi:copper chaperone
VKKIILKVEGISCQHCVRAIEDSVGLLRGVEIVTVNLTEKEVTVSFNEQKVSVEQVVKRIEEEGYEVESRQLLEV